MHLWQRGVGLSHGNEFVGLLCFPFVELLISTLFVCLFVCFFFFFCDLFHTVVAFKDLIDPFLDLVLPVSSSDSLSRTSYVP